MDRRGFWIPGLAPLARDDEKKNRSPGKTEQSLISVDSVDSVAIINLSFRTVRIITFSHPGSPRSPHPQSSRKPAQRAIRDPGKTSIAAAWIGAVSGFRLALPRLMAGLAWPE